MLSFATKIVRKGVKMGLLDVNDSNFQEIVLNSEVPVIVDFWAEWCAPCKKLEPILEEIEKAYNEKVRVARLNVEENPRTAAAYAIRSIPALIIFYNGEPADTIIGLHPKAYIEKLLRRYL